VLQIYWKLVAHLDTSTIIPGQTSLDRTYVTYAPPRTRPVSESLDFDMSGYQRPLSFSDRRGNAFDDLPISAPNGKIPQQRPPRGPPTPSMSTPAADYDQQLTGSPPPPPTPAASPGPASRQPDWSQAADNEDFYLVPLRQHFLNCTGPARTRLLADLLNLCTSQELSFVHQFVSPLLKKDPFTSLPDELCLRVSR
jgi:F-box and WD-40 domain protein CDC4